MEEFTRGVHASLKPRDTAYTIANDGRRLIECDRVSVAIRKGSKCVIEAVSGQDLFDKRSNTVRLLGRLATAVVASGEPIWYTGDTTNMAPQVEDAVQEYVDESHSKTVAVLPLQRPLPLDEAEEDPDKRPEPERAVGALIVEQIEDARVPQKMLQRVGVVTQHSSTALANALEHNNLFLLPLWRVLGKARWLVKARTLPKTTLVAGGILAVVLFLTLWQKTLKMQATGTLQPVTRRNVYVEVDNSDVVQVLVELGDMVREGQLLARLDNPDLNAAVKGLQGDLEATQERIYTLRSTLALGREGGAQKRMQSQSLEGELSELVAKRSHLEKQLGHYEEKRSKLEVRSPIAGQVVTWNVKNLLRDRPLRRGETLMQIFDLRGAWHLEVEMPDKRMGHILQSQFEENEDELKVEFILESESNVTHVGKIKRVDASAEVRGDEGNTVLIEVEISDQVKEKLLAGLPPGASLRPGATVRAKVDCGSRSVGYVLFHDLIAFIQSKILFRWF